MSFSCPLAASLCLSVSLALLLFVPAFPLPAQPSPPTAPAPQIVFVCEHGSVKSLIAASHFNRLAEARGLLVRAISRGVTPDSSVPPKIASALAAEGFDVTHFKPIALKPEESTGALRVISIGADLDGMLEGRTAAVERWDEIPPASVDYAKSREALLKRIEALLSALGTPAP